MVIERSLPAIRQLTLDDLDSALQLSSTAGWNQQRADWHMLLTIAPTGSFAALDDSGRRIVGTSIGIDYGGFGWIAMMLVDPAYRGRGLGARLLEAAMDAVPAGLPIRLDATPMGRPLYQRYGFADEAMLMRHVATVANRGAALSDFPAGAFPHPLDGANLETIGNHDRDIFGGNRLAVLGWALESAPQYARILQSVSGVPQYCFGRQGRLFDQIGPIVALDDDGARALLGAAVHAAGDRAIVADVFEEHRSFAGWLHGCGFRAERPLFRMLRTGATSPATRPAGRADTKEFAIFGPEFA
jgi:GNAT superfamily N-acetyltransferase